VSRRSQGHGCEVVFVAAAAVGVVGGVGVPAGPDDAEPGAGEDAYGVCVAAASGAGVAVDAFGPGGGVAGLVGVEGERLARLGVGGIAKGDGALLAAAFGHWDGAAERSRFVGAFGAVEQWPDLGDELAEVDRADRWQRPEQLRPGVLVDGGGDGAVEVAYRLKQGARESRLCEHELGDDFRIEGVRRLGRLSQASEQLASAASPAVRVAAKEGFESGLTQLCGGLRRRLALEEVERDLAVKPCEDCRCTGPMLSERRCELIGRGHARLHVIVAHSHQGLQPARRLVEWSQRSQPVLVGAEQVGEPVGLADVGLRAGALPARPGRVEGVGVDWHYLVAGLEQPIDEQSVRACDRDQKLRRTAELAEPLQRTGDPVLGVREAEALGDGSAFVDDAKLMRSARPIDPDEEPLTSLIDDTYLGSEGPSRVLIRWPSTRLTPNAGRGPSARSGRRDSRWLSESKQARPAPSGRQEHRRTLTSGSDGMVKE
jgi:hypothetical protein